MSFDDRIKIYKISDKSLYYYFPSNNRGTGGMQCYELPIGNRVNYVARSHSHGAKNTADGKLNGRMFTIKGVVHYTTLASLTEEMAKMVHRCQVVNDNPNEYWLALPQFYLSTAGTLPYSRFYYIDSMISYTPVYYEDGVNAEVEVIIGCGDPFGYKQREDSAISNVDADNTAKTVTVTYSPGDYPRPVNPVLRVTVKNGETGTLRGFNIKSNYPGDVPDSALSFWFNQGITANGYAEIDFDAGTCVVSIDGTTAEFNAIKYLKNGNFYSLLSGTNSLSFSGYADGGTPECQVFHKWRAKWL